MGVYLRPEIDTALKTVLKTIKSVLDSNVVLDKTKSKILKKTLIQCFLSLKFDNKLENIILSTILESCLTAEKISAGSFIQTLEKVTTFNVCTTPSVYGSYHASRNDILQVIQQYTDSKSIESMIKDAIFLAGMTGKISIEKSSNGISSIEKVNSFEFICKPFEKKPIKIVKAKVIAIDGYVESVAELHRLFEELASTKYQTVIFARGFDDEVIKTIEVNKTRSTMSVFPIIVPFDIDGINKIVDICIVCGIQPITPNLGRLITTASLEDSATIDEISIFNSSISIKNLLTHSAVENHLKNLLKKMEESKGAEEVYEKRIRSLSSNKVIIRLPDNENYVADSQSIDYVLRATKNLLDYGVTKDKRLFSTEKVSEVFVQKIYSTLSELGAVVG